MKFEVEVTDDEIRSAVQRKVRTAVDDQTNQWRVDAYIKERVAERWELVVDALVADVLKDSKIMREKIEAEIDRKLRAQIAVALRAVKNINGE